MAFMPSTQYKVGIKREIVEALRDVFAEWPDAQYRDVSISLEYPNREIHYPHIMVEFSESGIHSAGIGHTEAGFNEAGTFAFYHRWQFEAQIKLTVFALSALERDELSAGIVSLLAFRTELPAFKRFFEEIHDQDFVSLQVMVESLTPGGDAVSDVPWDEPERKLYTSVYSIDVFGEFFVDDLTGDLVRIDEIYTYPYREDQPVPQGSQHPDDIDAPWF